MINNKILSVKHRRKISESLRGRRHTPESIGKMRKRKSEEHRKNISKAKRGEKHPMYGRNHTEEARRKIGESSRKRHAGSGNPGWRGGVSFNPYPLIFNETLKTEVRVRDDFICQFCGILSKDVHHIDYDKKNCAKGNLITVCRKHNVAANTDRDKWEFFFTVAQHYKEVR